MSERIAIVGASARAAAASALRAGFEPIAADRFDDDDLRRIAPTTRIADYPSGLLDWIRQLEPKPIAWHYTGGLENHPDLIDAMAAVCPLWGNGGNVIREVRSPWRLAEVLREAGLNFPETRRTPDSLPCDGTWLAKTGRGAGGSGVRSFTAERDNFQQCFYQRRMAGELASAIFVAADGGATLLGVVHQLVGENWLGASTFQYCGAIGPFDCPEATFGEIERVGRVIAAEFRLSGLFGVDLVIDGECIWTIEVNPRYPASTEVVERTTGVHAMAAHCDACTGQLPIPRTKVPANLDTRSAGKAILFAKHPVTVSTDFASWEQFQPQSTAWPIVADLSPLGTPINIGAPIMSVFAFNDSMHKTKYQLQCRVAEIERSLYVKLPVS